MIHLMRFLLALSVFFMFSLSAAASDRVYRISIDISENGKNLTSPTIVVKEGNSAVIEDSEEYGYKISVTPTAARGGNILLSSVINISGSDVSSPNILVKDGGETIFSYGNRSIRLTAYEFKGGS
jgi:hypothetical protein